MLFLEYEYQVKEQSKIRWTEFSIIQEKKKKATMDKFKMNSIITNLLNEWKVIG